MKFFQKSTSDNQQEKTENNGNKNFLYVAGEAVIFFMVFSGIKTSMSPESMMEKELIEPNTVVESVGGQFIGQTINGFYEGQGTFQHLKGGVYTGKFTKSLRNGEGKFEWTNGDHYEGTWKQDAMLNGTYTFKNGVVYKGTFSGNKLIEGSVDFSAIGNKFRCKQLTGVVAEGRLTKIISKGTDGSSYDGDVTGKANITYRSGNSYSGDVSVGQRNGQGVFSWKYGTKEVASYHGGWMNDKMHGSGTYYYSGETYPKIEGNFENGELNGVGKYYKNAGKTFNTTWKNGKCISNKG